MDNFDKIKGFRMPAEFELHDGCIMIWPMRPGSWPHGGKAAQKAFCQVAALIAESEPVYFLADSERAGEVEKILETNAPGDLGSIGQKVLIDLLRDKGYDISAQHMDCGIEIYDAQTQDTHAGGSGCGCSAVTLSAYILRQIEAGHWNRVLFMPTGALLSKTSFNEGQSVPGIAHALVLEQA